MDWGSMDRYDWVSPALGLTIKCCRDAVRPDRLDQGSKPSLVFPDLIMESWVLSHFPSLLPQGFTAPRTYPAVLGWGTCNRKKLRFDYHDVRRELNVMTYEKFVPKPWGGYTDVPARVWERFEALDCCRLYLSTPFGGYWYLGERLAHQTVAERLVVPSDPPAVLFTQTEDVVARCMKYFEGSGDDLLLPGEDYGAFARRLGPRTIEVADPDMAEQPPEFYDEGEYE
ncbi:hypothetical protein RND81_06G086400 [Saponaria officinalis]|uniref:Aminotransferase-like plant mobile domain-containing protein n=1 Tax=Saponaria officinalis TaxID=3572 RepID=A0AAW1K4X7_SAPOF